MYVMLGILGYICIWSTIELSWHKIEQKKKFTETTTKNREKQLKIYSHTEKKNNQKRNLIQMQTEKKIYK